LKVFCISIVVLTVAFFAGGKATTDSKATGGDKAVRRAAGLGFP
jgi:hypothetical protein